MRLSLYERLKPEHKQKLTKHYANYKFQHKEIVEVLSNEYFFTQVRYGIAVDIEFVCNIKFFGDAFNE
mgnify:CR=1 FL=1|tara:strand:+ start:457 stop:660 length:204 start_codon:yes stop_codon:yes gene_type:complete